jgi:drug/metabolite transporter (DMT)-like permease
MRTDIFSVVLIAALLHALWNFAARSARGNLSVLWLGIALASVCCLPFALASVVFDRTLVRGIPYILATGVVHAAYFVLLGKSYETGEISSVYPVARGTGVMGTGLIAYVLLRESVSLCGASGMVLICAGIFLIGTSDRHRRGTLQAILFALAVGASIAIYSIIDKVGVGLVNPVFYIFGMFSVTVVILAPVIFVKHRRECRLALLTMQRYIWLIGIGSMGTYLIILFTYRTGMVSYIVAVREFSVVIGALLGVIILKEHFSPAKGLGIAAITAGLILIKIAG